MKNEQKGGSLPLIAGGVLMVVCCAAPAIFGAAALGSIAAWFGGFTLGETVTLVGLAALIAYGALRLRGVKADADAGDSDPAPK